MSDKTICKRCGKAIEPAGNRWSDSEGYHFCGPPLSANVPFHEPASPSAPETPRCNHASVTEGILGDEGYVVECNECGEDLTPAEPKMNTTETQRERRAFAETNRAAWPNNTPAAPATPQVAKNEFPSTYHAQIASLKEKLSAALSEVSTLKKEAAEMKRQRDMLLDSDRHIAVSSLQAEVATLREENAKVSMTYGDLVKRAECVASTIESHVWDNMNISDQRDWAVDQLAASQQKMDALVKAAKEGSEWIRDDKAHFALVAAIAIAEGGPNRERMDQREG